MPEKCRPHRRRADDDAVEVGRIALRHQHALAPAGRAAHEVRVRGGLAVVLREDLLREHGHAADRLVGEVEARLLLRHEGRVEDLPAVAGVGGDDGEAAGERGIALPRPAERRRHGAVQAAAALEQEAAVPVGGEREREADAVALAVRAGAPVEGRAQPAVGRQLDGERRHPGRLLRRGRAGREPFRRHLRQRGARHLQLAEGRARGLAGRYLRPGRRGGKRECGDRRTTEDQDSHARHLSGTAAGRTRSGTRASWSRCGRRPTPCRRRRSRASSAWPRWRVRSRSGSRPCRWRTRRASGPS